MDPSRPEQDAESDDRVDSLINEFFDRRKAGEELTPESFLAHHADIADQLRPFLEGLSFLDQIRLAADDAGSAEGKAFGDATRPTDAGYELLEEIGRGGMGVVYRALQVSTQRIVALKVMLAGPFASPSAKRRFEREIVLGARLQHPAIVQVLESGYVAQQPYYAMEYVAGIPLDRYLSGSQADTRTKLSIFEHICRAVDHAHAHGVIHRDLKPANVLMDDEGHPHILDFGLAKATDRTEVEEALTTCVSHSGQVMGTLPYLSPEQAAGKSDEIDTRTDVYALGVMLFEAMTGSRPIDATGRSSQVLQRVIKTRPTSPRTVSDQVDGDLETIILKALEKEKDRRYQSAAALADDIRRYLDGEPILARRPSSLYVLRKKLRRHRLGVGISAGLLFLASVGVWSGIRSRHREFGRARRGVLSTLQVLERGEVDKALGSARIILADHPDMPEALLVFARAQFRARDLHNEALQTLEQGLKREDLEPWHWAFHSLLADFYRDSGDFKRAEELQTQVQRLMPDTDEAWYVGSLATIRRDRARQCAEKAVNRNPNHALAWHRLARLCFRTEDWDRAAQAIDRLIELGEPEKSLNLLKSHILARQGRYDQAIEQYTKLLSDSAGQGHTYPAGKALWCRAHLFRRIGRYDKALEDYRALERFHHGDPGELQWVYYQEASVLWMLDRPDEAIKVYQRFSRRYRRPSYAHARLFLILNEQGREKEAVKMLRKVRVEAQDARLKDIFACLAGDLSPEKLVESARTPKQRCEACYYAGEAARLRGYLDQARDWFRQSVETGIWSDPDLVTPTPMNEYDLAEWRLKRMAADE